MKIYVVETIYDYVTQVGFSTSKEVAEKMAKKYNEKGKKINPNNPNKYWVEEYNEGKNLWCEFESC